MQRYQCSLCSYVYDPQNGDVSNGAAAGVGFADLPAGWCCPDCGAGQDAFDPID